MTACIAFGTASVGKTLILVFLEQAHRVDLAGLSRTAPQAIELIHREKPHLIIVEEVLGYGTGLEVVEQVRRIAGASIIVMVSTGPQTPVPDDLQAKRVDLWLRLPEDEGQLRQTLGLLLESDPSSAIDRWRNA
jgi:response regulator of citrate/malate metabolism